MQTSISLLALTVAAGGPLAVERFITQAGAYPAAGASAFGVTRTNAAAKGDLVPVDVVGTAVVTAGAAIALDDPLMVDAEGRVVPLTAGKAGVAKAMGSASAAGDRIEVLLTPTAQLVA